MKVAFDTDLPFSFAHGGLQIQIEQTKLGLERIGVTVEWMRRWDPTQVPDLIHFFGNVATDYIHLAHGKNIKVVLSELRGGMGARPAWVIASQKAVIRSAQAVLPKVVLGRLQLDTYHRVDAAIALTPWEAHLMQHVLGCPPARLHVVPNGVEEEFFEKAAVEKTRWVICTATIHPRKRVLELAQAAVLARVPLWIIGEPYSQSEEYYERFSSVVRSHPDLIRYEGGMNERATLARAYRSAKGFALVSSVETLSLSALEAAASGCPLLLTNLPWARATFGKHAFYCENSGDPAVIARDLRHFYDHADAQVQGYLPLRWQDIARQLLQVYEMVLSVTTPSRLGG